MAARGAQVCPRHRRAHAPRRRPGNASGGFRGWGGPEPAPSAATFDAAVKAVADAEAEKATGPHGTIRSRSFFAALRFITTVTGEGDAFVQPPRPTPEPVDGEEPHPTGAAASAGEFHRAMWRDPESAPRALIAADGALSAKMKTWLEENIAFADKDVMGGPDPEAPEVIKTDKVLVADARAVLAAKETALPGVYVEDARMEGEAAYAMVRWCYSVPGLRARGGEAREADGAADGETASEAREGEGGGATAGGGRNGAA